MSSSPRFLRIAVVLGLLSAIGPFAIDMYLPALPAIGHQLGTDFGTAQLSLTVFFISIGIGQLLYGPVSDMVGRRPPMFFGMALFALASVGCALATDIHTLIVLRFVQGLGAAAGMAIPRAVVRDLHTGPDAARLMSLLMLVFSVSPILAPLAGSGVIAAAGWRAVFWAIAVAAVAGLALLAFSLEETRPPSARVESSLGSALRAYGRLLLDAHFLGLVFIGGFAMMGFFIYLSTSSFVMIGHYGLTPTQYSIAFGVNAAAFFGAAQLNGRLSARFGLVPLVRVGVLGASVAISLMLAHYLTGGDSLAVLIGLYFVASAFMGLVIPTTAVLALENHGAIAGTAAALMGTLQMLGGAVGMAVVSLFNDGRPLPMVLGMAAGLYLSLTLTLVTLGVRGRRLPSPA
ncbi:multidrug effflux MFS transporter [Pseudacidovorax intermedius]|uniref:Bcr/CflA family efflux transporter n=1 Tax=Pseudacidovorax intermedius TaxID=433924 RepID=A0A370F738_9BURK|nr:multidrug effflux MFS transporter [Pseudacidovorax intermedius]RDI20047.1 DHA1 family bicyclomycin/chloramphenicol resistance-like MFS transporter [Pseudacidovorax intermedius]